MRIHENKLLPLLGFLNMFIQIFWIRLVIHVEDDGYATKFGIIKWVTPFMWNPMKLTKKSYIWVVK
jgi:hypothetical protein